ncbi:hypothetical protein [Streptomyces sp. LMG1-1-1.1]
MALAEPGRRPPHILTASSKPTGGIVANEEPMARHRLELPFAFVPSSAA